ncbi:exodeoxyribonuclease III [Schaalia meyeri]|uniref:Exodeoxyribonuclease III n=1 Tax=Schaalia meyeri TaxID=52773 RepID=A0AAP9Y635_9ACTO|nr:exodeoxyribonuclease III [Schaalia meyeri]QQC43432.1 exodeoxyribonuclease III [Schaalia meyeri]SDR91558.1 exodeoxyribonuclease-3 [Schaalia meyeri]
MRIATWNVNSIRTRIDRVQAFLERSHTDVLAMQEIKCRPEQFPTTPFEQAGYHVAIHGQGQWNGVAVASRLPITDIQDHFPTQPGFGTPPTVEARALGVTIDTSDALLPKEGEASSLTVWSLYVPNGRELTHPHYAYKLDWLAKLAEQGRSWLSDPGARIALVGDWNVAPNDEDVWDMAAFEDSTHVSAPEREAFAAFARDGWIEVTRDRVTNYTYWDYQKLRFPRNQGMRIDFAYCSAALAARVTNAQIDRDERKGKGASDHVPVIIDVA